MQLSRDNTNDAILNTKINIAFQIRNKGVFDVINDLDNEDQTTLKTFLYDK